MSAILRLWAREPAAVVGVISALVALAAGFGLKLSADQVSLIMTAVSAIGYFVVRSQVSPVAGSPPPPTITQA